RNQLPPDRSSQRRVQRSHDRRRQQPPGVDRVVGQRVGRSDQRDDRDRRRPVVADDEAPPEAPERGNPAHASASSARRRGRSWRSRTTSAPDAATTNATTASSAASEPGQRTPAPSPAQKIPNDVRSTPTANLIVFSGTRASGARTATPTAPTRTTASAAPAAASGTLPCVLPNATTMNATSSPSSSTPLNASVKPYQSTPARSTPAAPRAPSSSWANTACSSCSALKPAARRIALRSHWSPNTSRSAPTKRRRSRSGTTVSAGPSATTTTASASSAAPRPASAERHPLATPAASTIVSASTVSTALARKADRTRSAELIRTLSPPGAPGARCSRRAL